MSNLLLIIIFLSFISLGLPDSSLGASWPVMYGDLGVSIAAAGVISFTVTLATIVSSLMSGHLLKRFGTGRINLISTSMTALALIGFAWSPSIAWILAFAIPLGLGAGSVDAGLNSFVALHYKAHHMNWLHSFWGVGATLGPIIIAQVLSMTHSWRMGYWTVGGIQASMAVVLLISLPLWKIFERGRDSQLDRSISMENVADPAEGVAFAVEQTEGHLAARSPEKVHLFKTPGLFLALLTFILYCGAEAGMGLWGSSFLVNARGLSVETAGRWVSFYFGGIMAGRFLSGFLVMKWATRKLMQMGILISLAGALVLMASAWINLLVLPGFIMIGLGFAPVFPGMIHETPKRFGQKNSQVIIGYQMAASYVGITLFPPAIGLLAANVPLDFLPPLILVIIVLLLLTTQRLNRVTK